jgi:hypothetical protein
MDEFVGPPMTARGGARRGQASGRPCKRPLRWPHMYSYPHSDQAACCAAAHLHALDEVHLAAMT